MFLKAGAALLAFSIACYVSTKIIEKTQTANRAAEFSENERSEALTQSGRDWTLVHIRDDVGSIHNLLILANGLLAAILATLIF
jgi:hypothetical protein